MDENPAPQDRATGSHWLADIWNRESHVVKGAPVSFCICVLIVGALMSSITYWFADHLYAGTISANQAEISSLKTQLEALKGREEHPPVSINQEPAKSSAPTSSRIFNSAAPPTTATGTPQEVVLNARPIDLLPHEIIDAVSKEAPLLQSNAANAYKDAAVSWSLTVTTAEETMFDNSKITIFFQEKLSDSGVIVDLPIKGNEYLRYIKKGDNFRVRGNIESISGNLLWIRVKNSILEKLPSKPTSLTPDTSTPSPASQTVNAQNSVNKGFQGFNNGTVNIGEEEKSLKDRLKDLLNEIDPTILTKANRGLDAYKDVEKFEYDKLQDLLKEPNSERYLKVDNAFDPNSTGMHSLHSFVSVIGDNTATTKETMNTHFMVKPALLTPP